MNNLQKVYKIFPILSKLFWGAAIVFTVAAWVSVIKNDLVWNYGAQWWIWNSIMFGILALYGHHCRRHE